MRTCSLLLCLAVVPATGGCTQPAGMYQQAQVRIVDSQLCFTVADTDEARRTPPMLTAISVNRFTGADWEYVWRWITPLEPAVTLTARTSGVIFSASRLKREPSFDDCR